MIEKLTPEQEKQIPIYSQRWISAATDPTRLSKEESKKIINRFQEVILEEQTTPILIFPDPITTWQATCVIYSDEEKYKGWTEEQILTEIEVIKKDPDREQLLRMAFTRPYISGSYDASIFGFYDFMFEVLQVPLDEDKRKKYDEWKGLTKLGLAYPLDSVCVMCHKPTALHIDSRGRLHCENGMALAYGDWGFYSLNGVRVPEYLVMTPAEELSMDFYLKEKNADVKAEFVRKFGVERMIHLGKKVDSYENYDQEEQPWWWKSEYELHDMAVLFDGLDYQPYLKMRNQTTGIWHLEAVSPECRSLNDAIKERFGGKDMKIIAIA